jgi:hypothetical protein
VALDIQVNNEIMGNSSYEKQGSDVILNPSKKQTGLLFISDNKFFKRLWFLLSNPFRYLFTGRVRY